MKRIIAAVAFATLAAPALADNLPFEQAELDRQLPNVAERASQGERTATGFAQYDAI